MVHTCNTCKKDFKYESILKRHLAKKTPCSNSNINHTIIKDNNINIPILDNNTNNDLFNILSNKLSKTQIINMLISLINTNSNSNNNIINNDNNINDINNEKINNKYSCKNCNSFFYDRQGVYKHNKLGRCKGKQEIILEDNIIPECKKKIGTTLNNILGININDSDNIKINNNNNNDNSITNNITNNNPITNIITINAFGCESLDHITTLQFKSLFKNFNHLHKILYKLSNLVYIKNSQNMNFTKNNMNKNIVTYLDCDMEVKQISEREFIKEFEENIKKLCIELFHIHKDDISLDNLIEYMKSFLLFYDTLQEKKINHIELKEQLKSIMDYVFRDEDINEVIRKIKVDLQNNKDLKSEYIKNNTSRLKIKNKRLNEYYSIPNKDNTDNKNLNRIKETAIDKNIKDKKQLLANKINNSIIIENEDY